jgi:hypothetical protein
MRPRLQTVAIRLLLLLLLVKCPLQQVLCVEVRSTLCKQIILLKLLLLLLLMHSCFIAMILRQVVQCETGLLSLCSSSSYCTSIGSLQVERGAAGGCLHVSK